MINLRSRYGALTVAVLTMAVICLIPAIVQAEAQLLKADIPFDFYVGSQKLPAGQYTVTRLADPALLRIFDGNGHGSLTMSTEVYNRPGAPGGKLIFNRYGDQNFLCEVRWLEGSSGRQLPPSSLEARIAKNRSAEKVFATTNNR